NRKDLEQVVRKLSVGGARLALLQLKDATANLPGAEKVKQSPALAIVLFLAAITCIGGLWYWSVHTRTYPDFGQSQFVADLHDTTERILSGRDRRELDEHAARTRDGSGVELYFVIYSSSPSY